MSASVAAGSAKEKRRGDQDRDEPAECRDGEPSHRVTGSSVSCIDCRNREERSGQQDGVVASGDCQSREPSCDEPPARRLIRFQKGEVGQDDQQRDRHVVLDIVSVADRKRRHRQKCGRGDGGGPAGDATGERIRRDDRRDTAETGEQPARRVDGTRDPRRTIVQMPRSNRRHRRCARQRTRALPRRRARRGTGWDRRNCGG